MRQGEKNIGVRISMLFGIAALALACFAASASAAKVHVFSHTFGMGLSLTAQSGIATNQDTGEVYVADTGHARIAKFTAAGSADGTLATITAPAFVAVDNSTGPSKGDIYVVEGEGTVTKLDPAGALVAGWGTGGHLGGLGEVLGIATNHEGNLWVLTQSLAPEFGGTFAGKEFDQAGTLIHSWSDQLDGGHTARRLARAGIAVDSADNMYVISGRRTNESGGTVLQGTRKLTATGSEVSGPNGPVELGGGVPGVATDSANNDLYLGRGEEAPYLSRYSSELEERERFGGNYEGTLVRSGSAKDGLLGISAITVTESSVVYAVDSSRGKVAVYELEEVQPPSVSLEAPDSVTQTSAHVVGHVDPNATTGSSPSHNVTWSFQCTPACPGHEGYIEVELDGSNRTVEATIGDLRAGTKYSVRIIGRNRGGEVEAGPESFETDPAAPTVTDSAASEVYGGEATLNAVVNPNGAESTYHFEYMTRSAFDTEGGFLGAQVLRTPESLPLEAETTFHQVSVRVGALEPGIAYVFRAVATNSVGPRTGSTLEFRSQVGPNPPETSCPNQLLRTEEGARLPDCRGYELVTPADKNGGLVEPFNASLHAAPDGSGVSWYAGQTATGIPSPSGAHQDFAFHLSSLAGGSWTSRRLLAPETLGELSDLVGLSADERYALLETSRRGGFDPGLYLLNASDQALTPVVPPQVGQQTNARAFSFDGSSVDDMLFFFESRLQLTPSAAAGKDNLYVWNRATGTLSLGGVLPGSKAEAPAGGSFGGAYSWSGEAPLGPVAGGAEQGLYVGSLHAISESGDSVYFTAGGTGQLYLRRGLTSAKPTTLRVSVANPGVTDPNGEKPAAFQEATPDGQKVFFLSSEKLTKNANTGPSDEGADLYRYDAETKTLVDTTPLTGGAGARVQGLVGIAEDGRSGYLVARGVLAAGGVQGESNLYHFAEEGGGGVSYKLVATLSPPNRAETYQRNWSARSNEPKTARVSADGSTAIFMSVRPLTGGVAGNCIYGACMQVYRYSMAEESLACLSCNPTGEGPPLVGAELFPEISPVVWPGNAPNGNGSLPSSSLPRNLSASGTRVFFQSSEPFLPEDVNGAEPHKNCTYQGTCVDVYEWEAVGTGSCKTPNQAGGCLYLISTGESGQSSYFLNASADGSSAFVLTSSSLVPLDEDELTDVYDARVDGGLASQHMSTAPPCGSSEACKGPSSTSSAPASAGTSSFQGPGNIEEAEKCKSGVARKHGRCAKKLKKHQKKQRHKKTRHRATGKKSSGGAK